MQAISVVDGGRSLDVAGRSEAVTGRWSLADGARAPAGSGSIDVFGLAEKIHKSLLVGLGFVVQAASFAMLATVCAAPFLAALRFRRNLMGWHRLVGWALLPVLVIPPATAVLMTLGIGHGGVPLPPSSHPLAMTQALARAGAVLDLSRLEGAHPFRGGSVFLTLSGPDGGAYVVSDAAVTKLSGGPGLIQEIHEGTWAGAWSGALNFVVSLALLALTVTGVSSFVRRKRLDRRGVAAGAAPTLVAYASQSGTAARLAAATVRALEAGREAADCAALGALTPGDLERYQRILLIASSTGDGELPEGGQRFVERLAGHRLIGVRFSLLGLGDRAYRRFCGGGEALRSAMIAAGAEEALPMARADGDPEPTWKAWLEAVGDAFGLGVGAADLGFDRIALRIEARTRLDDPAAGDTQETWAVTLASEADLAYRPGDLLRVAPRRGGRERSYSIGSSARVDPRRIVLTLTLHRWIDEAGAEHFGEVSGELVRSPVGEALLARIQPNPAFNPPDDPASPIVMIAAGSGVAPFPGFLDEREASGRPGRAWLVFGNRHRAGDFLWSSRWEAAVLDRSLTRIDTAFSRDPDDGAYVQHRLEEHGAELRRWIIDRGASVYVCGRGEMARAARETIARVVEADRALSPAAAARASERVFVDAFD